MPPSAAPPALVIVGASVRGLAESAARAGWAVHAADLFADADLTAVARVAVCVASRGTGRYPRSIAPAIERFPAAPWIYTGALENHPRLIDAIARRRPLAGNPGRVARAVRDPRRLAAVVAEAGMSFPETRTTPRGVPRDGSFLVKPRASAGGHGIRPWHGPEPTGRLPPAARVWQRRVAGASWSAAYVMRRGACRLLGASRQLVGAAWCRARGFAYSGSVDVPLERLPDHVRDQFERLGRALAEAFELVGLVGVDLVVDRRQRLHVIEVNPRPTASMELVERATGESIAAAHLGACGVAAPGVVTAPPPGPRGVVWSKAVLFAPRDVPAEERLADRLVARAEAWSAADGAPALADIPRAGSALRGAAPVCTVFACGSDATIARAELRRRVRALRSLVPEPGVSRRAAVPRRAPPGRA